MVDRGEEISPEFGDGNEAIAWGALDAGVQYVSHYPGAPVSRVAGALGAAAGVIMNHAQNEHIAALAAIGASLCGARSLAIMKHVGLNVAADPLNYAGAVKITGGMVVVVGTDPGARSSTGEEDVHWYAPQFNLPLFEPATVQGIYDALAQAFEVSECTCLPVLVFVPGRLAYQSAEIRRRERRPQPAAFRFSKDPQTLINVGMKAVKNHRDQIARLSACAQQPAPTVSAFDPAAEFGVITRGATYAVVREAVEELQLAGKLHLLNIGRTFPLHKPSLLSFARGKKKIVVIEDQDGFLETVLKRELFGEISCPIQGKNLFPPWGEISHQQVRDYLGSEFDCPDAYATPPLPEVLVAERPGACCEGCPHRPTLFAIGRALRESDGVIGGDIGCSSLPPHRTDWLLCMNAGIGMAQGIAQLLPQRSLVSTGGDGSLFHAGLLSLQSAVMNGINLTHIILDNRSVAMTGHQPSPTTTGEIDLRGLLRAVGVQHILEVDAFMPSLTALAVEKARALEGVKVIWVRGECALQAEAGAGAPARGRRTLAIASERCQDCTLCYGEFQCPSIVRSPETGTFSIDAERCRRCGACLDLCPNGAIRVTETAAGLVSSLMSVARTLRRLSFRIRS